MLHLGNLRHTYAGKNLREVSVKVSVPSEHLQEDIQVSIQCQERFMTHIDRCEIFIATFIATFIAPFDENRLKPNRDQGLSPFR